MNTRNTYRRERHNGNSRFMQAPVGMAHRKRPVPLLAVPLENKVLDVDGCIHSESDDSSENRINIQGSLIAKSVSDSVNSDTSYSGLGCDSLPIQSCRHPLTDLRENAHLARCEEAIKGRFDAIVPTLKKISLMQHEKEFISQAQKLAKNELGAELPNHLLENAWVNGLDMRTLYASCTFGALQTSVAQFAENLHSQAEEAVDTKSFFLDCGYHCVDITACSDGRLKGLSKYVLRLPLSAMTVRNDYAGSLFNVEANIRHWESIELARFRASIPVDASAGTHYLKVVVYHRSSSDPSHQGCAAHASNDRQAAEEGLERLNEFRTAIENSFCCGASVDILLICVDTDTDSVRIHVPDSNGDINIYRYVDSSQLYHDTLNCTADDARIAVYESINKSSEVDGWGGGAGQPREGMRKLIVNLLINNLSQIEYVGDLYEGRYPDIGHAERYISVGDGFQEVQLRNIAYYAHLHTVEEGSADMDIGIKIFTGLNLSKGLPIPIAIHYRYNSKVPGSRQRMVEKCNRVRLAILERYKDLVANNNLICQMSLQDLPLGSRLEVIEEVPTA